MSGIIGHTTYAILAAKAASARRLPVAPLIHRHFSSYLAGAYLGCDIQTMPAAICVDTGEEVGHGPSPIDRSPITGGPVKPWSFAFEEKAIAPREIHETFYGRSHLILGWQAVDKKLAVGWGDYLDYAADVTGDAIELFGPGQRALAYVLGWMTHVTGDGLIKSVLEGINLHLLDGKYTATNRPVQDLISFNDIGKGELGLNWAAMLDDLATTPVEPVQLHYMRCAARQGRLGAHFENGWAPEKAPLLTAVLAENRRYQRKRNLRLIEELTLRKGPNGEASCDAELSRITGGLSYLEMREAAEKANFRHALWQMGELIADGFEKVINRQERLQELPTDDGPNWSELSKRWSL
ncbi:MAG: hypothetical protein KDN20_11120 [Verrucomicrobiae bacterium]|nr:hypothetical protein [Verrucomicrobiae bacterium]